MSNLTEELFVRLISLLLSFAGCLAIVSLGCRSGNSSKTVKVEGTVTLEGKPLSNATVIFFPAAGQRPANGSTDSIGRFHLSTFQQKDGAVPGEHTVAVVPKDPPPMPGQAFASPGSSNQTAGPYVEPFPARYHQPSTSGLTATVAADRKNEFAFELKRR